MNNNQLPKPTQPVLVIGGTGATGRHVVAQLVETGDKVRVLTRNPTNARRVLPSLVEVVEGDLKSESDVRRAVNGVRAVVLAHGTDDGKGTAEDTDYGGVLNVVQSLGNGPVKLVLMSAIYVTRPDHPNNNRNPVFEWKRRAEELVRESGQPYSIARASWLSRTPSVARSGVRLEQSDMGEGNVGHAAMASVLVQALRSAQAVGKTFEVYASGSTSHKQPLRFDSLEPDRSTTAHSKLNH